MNRKIVASLLVGCFVSIVCTGCQSARVSGRDPLLGKTRVDPPTTNARSVYVERQNTTDSGVVPGGTPVETATAAQGTMRTVRYLDPGSETTENETNSDGTNVRHSSNAQNSSLEQNSSNAHLRWKNVHNSDSQGSIPKTSETATASATDAQHVSQPAGNGSYDYCYDFSVFPPRIISLNFPTDPYVTPETVPPSAKSEKAGGAGNTGRVENTENVGSDGSDGNIGVLGQIGDLPKRLVAGGFDPYAPNRTFERRREELSRNFSADFDEGFTSAPPAPRVQAASSAADSGSAANVTLAGTPNGYAASNGYATSNTYAASNTYATAGRGTSSASGWQVVSGRPTSNDAVPSTVSPAVSPAVSVTASAAAPAETVSETASVAPQIGSSVALPETSEEAPKTTKVPTRRARQDEVLNLLDLPE